MQNCIYTPFPYPLCELFTYCFLCPCVCVYVFVQSAKYKSQLAKLSMLENRLFAWILIIKWKPKSKNIVVAFFYTVQRRIKSNWHIRPKFVKQFTWQFIKEHFFYQFLMKEILSKALWKKISSLRNLLTAEIVYSKT